MNAGRTVLSTRSTMAYTVALTFMFGVFASYLATSELIFSEVFGRGEQFPVIFGVLASVMGVGMLANGRLVERLGLVRLIRSVTIAYLLVTSGLVGLAIVFEGVPNFYVFSVGLMMAFACHALLMPNLNSAAMTPMGAVAGTASAVTGTLSLAGGALIGAVIDRAFNGTVTPLSVAFLLCGVGAWTFTRLAESPPARVVNSPVFDQIQPEPGTD